MYSVTKMKFIFLLINAFTAKVVPSINQIPMKLQLYQNKTGITEKQLSIVYENSLKGKVLLKIVRKRYNFKENMTSLFQSFDSLERLHRVRTILSIGRPSL